MTRRYTARLVPRTQREMPRILFVLKYRGRETWRFLYFPTSYYTNIIYIYIYVHCFIVLEVLRNERKILRQYVSTRLALR